jgi:hypothetical protein
LRRPEREVSESAGHLLCAMQTRGAKRQKSGVSRGNDSECPICYEVFTKDQLAFPFGCGHGLCPTCDDALTTRNDLRCPVCRTPRSGVTSAEAESAAQRNAPIPDHALQTNHAFVFFRNQADFSLTNAFLFGGAEIPPPSFEPSRSALGYGRPSWRITSRFSRPSRTGLSQRAVQLQQQLPLEHPQVARPGINRALLLAQTAARALCDPSIDSETFAATIAAALMGEVPPPTS